MSTHATAAMLDNLHQTLIENMADFLDNESTKLDLATGLLECKDEEELHLKMANAAFKEFKKGVTNIKTETV